MSVIGSNILAGASGQGGYTIEESLRFNANQSSYLSRAQGSATSTTTGTWSGWCKRGKLGAVSHIWSSSNYDFLRFDANNKITIAYLNNAGYVSTTAVYRDPSAWYHIVLVFDTTNATAVDRMRLYVNGVQQTLSWGATPQTQNATFQRWNVSGYTGDIGDFQYNHTDFFDGYMAECYWIDGQALDPSSFGEFDSVTGVWQPVEYTGTYGNNGFYLPMQLDNTTEGFNTVTWVGNGSTQKIGGVGFSPDLVWIKSRDEGTTSYTGHHVIQDTVRGVGTNTALITNETYSEAGAGYSDAVTAFNTDGFTLGGRNQVNYSGDAFVAWCWDAGSSTVSNDAGSITSSVRANPTYGFSIVTWTGNGTDGATIGHGLGVAPKMVIVKIRSQAYRWMVYFQGVTNDLQTLVLNTAATVSSLVNPAWSTADTTSSVFGLGNNDDTNDSGETFVAYCFSEVAGYSKFGTYQNNNSTTGVTVTTGFRPAFIMLKCTDSGERWFILDNTRQVNNVAPPSTAWLVPNATSTEAANGATTATIDFLDDGFQIKTTNPASGEVSFGTRNYIYMAFADTREYAFWLDDSGNNNDWQPNGGITTESTVTDTPTIYAGGGNYAVLNPNIRQYSTANFASEGNLKYQTAAAGVTDVIFATIPMTSGKWFAEVQIVTTATGQWIGVCSNVTAAGYGLYGAGVRNPGYAYKVSSGNKCNNDNTGTAYGASSTTGDIIGIAMDADAGSITFYKNGVSLGVAFTDMTNSGGGWLFGADSDPNGSFRFNFGQRPFAYTPPTGFKSLHTGNLPDSTIVSGDDYFKTYLYTGNGGGLQVGEIQKPFTTYEVSNSLRFRKSGTAYLNKTFGSAPTSRTTMTMSVWVKRGLQSDGSTYQAIFGTFNNYENVSFNSDDTLRFTGPYSSGQQGVYITTQKFRDFASWYHIVVVYDTTNATAGNRMRLFVNGVQVTSFSTQTNSNQNNTTTEFLVNGAVSGIGTSGGASLFDGYLAEVNVIDGQALTPSDFGDYDGNNYWVPKAYTGTYGTNGFYLDFSDTTSTATLVADQSGAGNDWTPNNISLTAGTTYDSMVDSPTPYADAGNYAVLNPLDKNASATISAGNLTQNASASAWRGVRSTIFVSSGKWYWETTVSGAGADIGLTGVSNASANLSAATDADSWAYLGTNGNTYTSGTAVAYGAAYGSGDVIGVALDMDAGTLTFYKNNVSQGIAFSGLTGLLTPTTWQYAGYVWHANFGQRPFAYTPPTGFKTLNSFNIPEVTNDLETPDLVWIKSRSASQSHTLFDSVRGVHNYLESDDTAREATDVNSLLQFNKNGFLLGASAAVNTSGRTYVGWGWKAGTAFSNDAGTNGATIASVGSVNQAAGFNIVTYTFSTAGTNVVGHGLGTTPAMIIMKDRTNAANWDVYHQSIAYTSRLILNSTSATVSSFWASAPTSTTFSVASNCYSNDDQVVAYCFAEVEGYSKFGSYVGNNSPDGPFVYLGFRPAFLIIRSTSGLRDWLLWDTARGTANGVGLMDGALPPNIPGTAYTGAGYEGIDLLSNGFKWKNNDSPNYNTTETYIYMAFAENPFKNSLAR
jgi:hypothetical protein